MQRIDFVGRGAFDLEPTKAAITHEGLRFFRPFNGSCHLFFAAQFNHFFSPVLRLSIALTDVNIIDILTIVNIIIQVMKKKTENNQGGLDDLITVTDAAKLRGISRQAIHALVERGRLRSVNMFGRVLLYRSEVESFEKEKPGPKKGED
jgi:excisionase family DNA binding protein